MVHLIHHPLAGPQIRQMGGRGGYLMLAPSRHWWLLWLINRPRVSRGATLDPHLDGSSQPASLFATMRAIQITPVAFPALSFSTPSWGSTCPLSLPFTLCMCWEFLCVYLTLPAPGCDCDCACACTWPCLLLPLSGNLATLPASWHGQCCGWFECSSNPYQRPCGLNCPQLLISVGEPTFIGGKRFSCAGKYKQRHLNGPHEFVCGTYPAQMAAARIWVPILKAQIFPNRIPTETVKKNCGC